MATAAVELAPVAPGETTGEESPPDYTDRPKKIRKRLVRARAHASVKVTDVTKRTAQRTILGAMQALRKDKIPGLEKKAIVVDLVCRAADAAFKAMFPDETALAAFVGSAIDDAYSALGKKVFGRSGCC